MVCVLLIDCIFFLFCVFCCWMLNWKFGVCDLVVSLGDVIVWFGELWKVIFCD